MFFLGVIVGYLLALASIVSSLKKRDIVMRDGEILFLEKNE